MYKMSQKKQIFKIDVLKKLLTDKNSCVSLVPTTRVIALPPFFLNDMKSGIIYLLNSLLKKYDRALDGILIGYQNIKVLMDENTGIIQMGTAETEVNISVEFYIFQPKIGNFLQGVINKKSNNHIGCLVHKYFNATILKPEDVEFEDWICKDYNVDDKIIFKVKDLDFTGLLPYIEGVVDDTMVEKKKHCDTVKKIIGKGITYKKDCIKHNLSEEEIEKDEITNSLSCLMFSDKEAKPKHFNEEEVEDENDLNDAVNKLITKSLDEIDSNTDQRKKKKKKKKEKEKDKLDSVVDEFNEVTNETKNCSNLSKSSSTNEISCDDSIIHSKKKKRKKEKERQKLYIQDQREVHQTDPSSTSDKEVSKKEKEISKKEKKNKIINDSPIENLQTNQCLTQREGEENVFHSTQLDPSRESERFRLSFCSPILKDDNPRKKKIHKPSPERLPPIFDSPENVTKSGKKRKLNNEETDVPVSKKQKKSFPSEKIQNGDTIKPKTQSLLDKILEEQMSRVKETWGSTNGNVSDSSQKSKGKSSTEAKSEASLYEKLLAQARNSINLEKNSSKESKPSEKKKKKEREKELSTEEDKILDKKDRKRKLKDSKEDGRSPAKKLKSTCDISKNEKNMFSESEASSKSSQSKKVNGDVSNDVQSIIDRLCKEEMERLSDAKVSDRESVDGSKKGKKSKKKDKKKEKTSESLIEKLMKNAKMSMNLSVDDARLKNGSLEKKKKEKKEKNDLKRRKSLDLYAKSLF